MEAVAGCAAGPRCAPGDLVTVTGRGFPLTGATLELRSPATPTPTATSTATPTCTVVEGTETALVCRFGASQVDANSTWCARPLQGEEGYGFRVSGEGYG